jgi:hypothetical protein
MGKKDSSQYATHAEALNGIYIDFEGFQSGPPALLGILVDDSFEQVVFDPELLSAALATGLRFAFLDDEGRSLIQLSQRHDHCIFAFTRRELGVFEEYTSVADQIRVVYRDSHKIAKRWFKRFHSEEELPDWSLLSFLQFIGCPPPRYLGIKKATKHLRAVRDQIASKGSFNAITGNARGHWTKLLKHNELDCTLMRELTLRATAELEGLKW